MKTMIPAVLLLVGWGVAAAVGQLPPEILADSHLLRVEKAIGEGDNTRARIEIDKILDLLKERELDLPEEFHFRYAKAAASVGLPEQAHRAVVKYLTLAGRDGAHYVEALGLMNEAQDAIEGRSEPQTISPDQRLPAKPLEDFGRDSSSSEDDATAMSCEEWSTASFHLTATLAQVTACLDAGADPKALNEEKITPLHFASWLNEDPAVIKALVAAGGDPRARDDLKRTPLYLAAMANDNPAVIEALIAAGANIEAPDQDGDRPLNLADVYNKNPAVSRALISAGSNRKSRGKYKWTPLHRAAKFNVDPAVIEGLISAGSDPNARDKYRRTPLHEAAGWNENAAVVEALISAGSNLEARDRNKRQPLHEAAASNDSPAVVRALVEAGADLKARGGSIFNYTPLHYAARSNNSRAIIEALLDAGADPKSPSFHGTPLHLAAANAEDPAVIEALLDAGADLNRQASSFMDKAMPIHDAAKFNENPAVIRFLLGAGANLEARDKKGYTPLALAAENNSDSGVIEALLDAGADLRAQTNKGFTPLALATENNDNPAVRRILLSAGAGQVEKQLAAAEARRRAQSRSGPGLLDAVIGIAGGTAIATAGGGSDEAVAAGTVFAEGVMRGEDPALVQGRLEAASSPAGSSTVSPAAGLGSHAGGGGQCLIPGYPSPPDIVSIGLPWCPASVDFQLRSFALTAAGIHCSLVLPPPGTSEELSRRRRQIGDVCSRLEAIGSGLGGVSACHCPAGFGQSGYSIDAGAIDRERERIERLAGEREAARQAAQRDRQARQEETRQAAEREKRRIEATKSEVLNSDCSCIRVEDDGEYVCMDGFVGGRCDIRR